MAANTTKKNKMNFTTGLIIFVSFIILINLCDGKKKNTKAEAKKSSEYALTFSDDFKKGLASQDDLGLSIVIAIDCSGSMKEYPKANQDQPKYIAASQSLNEIVQFLNSFYKKNVKKDNTILKIGLVKFSDTVKVLFPLTNMNDETFQELERITSDNNNFLPDSKTAIGKTLERGTEMLMQSGTIFKSLIVVTDGENTEGEEPETVFKAIVNNNNNKTSKDFPVTTSSVLTSFIGFDIDSSTFSTLHELGARVTSAANKEELNASLKNIFLADITKLEAK